MIIDVKGAKQSAPSDEPSRQKYLLKELKNSSAPFAIAAALASVVLYLQSILPGMARPAPEARPDAAPDPGAQQPTSATNLQLVETDAGRVQIAPDAENDTPSKKAAASRLLESSGDRYELVDSPPMRFQSSTPHAASHPTSETWANDNRYPTPAHLESKPGSAQSVAARDGGGGEPQRQIQDGESEEEAEEFQNRAPRSTGHIVLPNIFGPTVITLTASSLLEGIKDPDGDALQIRNVTASSGTLIKVDEGWTFEPASPGAVTLRYEVTDGRSMIVQTAGFSAELPLPVFGSEAADTITGTAWADTIDGLGGDDMIDGLAGDDVLKGGDGDDYIVGGSGADLIFAGAGDDIVYGNEGDDTISGGTGDDNLSGDEGDDTIFGDAGNDVILGGVGNDLLFGGDGDDVMEGGAGADRLFGEAGNDKIDGGDGRDVMQGGDGDDVMSGGGGADVILGQGGADILAGDAGDDDLSGGDGDDTISGGDGADVIDGGAGDDTLHGDADDDVISDGEGADIVDGGSGDDRIIAAADAQNDSYAGGDGFDTIDYSASEESITINLISNTAEGLAIGEDTIEGFEHAIGGAGDDHFIVGHHSTILTGGGGENVFEFVAPPEGSAPPEPLLHKIVDFKPGDLIKMNKYDIFDEIADTLEDDFEAIYGKKVDADDAPVRYRYDGNDSKTKTIIEADVNRDGVYETTVVLEGRQALVIVEDA